MVKVITNEFSVLVVPGPAPTLGFQDEFSAPRMCSLSALLCLGLEPRHDKGVRLCWLLQHTPDESEVSALMAGVPGKGSPAGKSTGYRVGPL